MSEVDFSIGEKNVKKKIEQRNEQVLLLEKIRNFTEKKPEETRLY